jgi:uncharacterized protein YbcI
MDTQFARTQGQGDPSGGRRLEELATAMVGFYKESFGRGPTKAHARYAGRDIVICTLEDSMTPAERKLAAWNEHQRLREIRTFLQYATRRNVTAKVEKITGRRVRAFVSGIDTEHDVSSEVFYLGPAVAPVDRTPEVKEAAAGPPLDSQSFHR